MSAGSESGLLKPIPDDDSVFKTESELEQGSEASEQLTSEQELRLLQDDGLEPQAAVQTSVIVTETEEEDENRDPEKDLGRDEVWQQQQNVMEQNRQKRERVRKRLQREREIAAEKLREAEDREEMKRMEQEIIEINKKWSVHTKNLTNPKPPRSHTPANVKSKTKSGVDATKMAAKANKMAAPISNKRVSKSVPITASHIPLAHKATKNSKPKQKMSDLLMLDSSRNVYTAGTEADDEAESVYAVEDRDKTGLLTAVRGVQKVRTWLSSTEDLPYVHETRSDPGDTPVSAERLLHIKSHSNSSKALKEKEQQREARGEQRQASGAGRGTETPRKKERRQTQDPQCSRQVTGGQ